MKISVVIPYYESDPGKPAVLKRLTDSLRGYHEIIISGNVKEGYAIPINRGLRTAHGDFLIVMNDDLIMDPGCTLADLCDPDAVTSPLIDGIEQPFWGCCFCLPRWVFEKTGGLWEGYRVSYFDDDDFINVLRQNNIPMHSAPLVNFVNVDGGGRTLHTFPDHNEFFAENKERYRERWGEYPDKINAFYEKHGRLPTPDDKA